MLNYGSSYGSQSRLSTSRFLAEPLDLSLLNAHASVESISRRSRVLHTGVRHGRDFTMFRAGVGQSAGAHFILNPVALDTLSHHALCITVLRICKT